MNSKKWYKWFCYIWYSVMLAIYSYYKQKAFSALFTREEED